MVIYGVGSNHNSWAYLLGLRGSARGAATCMHTGNICEGRGPHKQHHKMNVEDGLETTPTVLTKNLSPRRHF